MLESKAHNSLLTKSILSDGYKFGTAQLEEKSIARTNLLNRATEGMEIYFEQENEAEND